MRYLVLVLILVSTIASAQQLPSQRELLDLERINAINDFGFKKKVPKSVTKRDFEKQSNREGVLSYKEIRFDKLFFNSENNLSKRDIKYSSFGSANLITKKYTYGSQGLLEKMTIFDENGNETNENTTYEYYPDSQLKKTTLTNQFGATVKEYSRLENGFITFRQPKIDLNLKYFIQSGRLKKRVKVNNGVDELSEKFIYDTKGNLSYSETSLYRTMYDLNEKRDLSEKSSMKLINDKSIAVTSNKYKYDKYGNWVANVSILNTTNYAGLPSLPRVSLREITYDNGEITGYKNPKDESTALMVDKLIEELMTFNNETVYKYAWKKNKDGSSYWFYIEGKLVNDASKPFLFEKDLYVFNTKTRGLFLAKDFNNKPDNTYHPAEKQADIGYTSGLWWKTKEGNFSAFNTNGVKLEMSKNFWTKNSKDLVVYGDLEKGEKYLLKDFKTAEYSKVYEAKMYHEKNDVASKSLSSNGKEDFKCIEGNCDNGFGKIQLPNNETLEGFFENSLPFGPCFLNKPKANIETFTSFKGDYNEPHGFEYNYTKNESSVFINRDTNIGLAYLINKNEFYVMHLSGSEIKKAIKLEKNANNSCNAGNCQDGAGFYVYNNGTTYMGFFKNGKLHGPGQLYFSNDQFYIGNFYEGKKSGLGTYVWDNDTNYFGEWKNDQYHGKGVYQYSFTNKKSGLWENGKYVKSLDGVSNSSDSKTYTNTASVSSSNYKLTELEKSAILKCGEDEKCLTKVFDGKYVELKKSISGDERTKKFTDYTLALNQLKPGQLFGIFMKSNYAVSSGIFDTIPKEVMDKIKKEAQELMNDYSKHINSKETRDAIEKHGGTIKQGN